MKTPRELLLKKHQPMEAKLDAVRSETMAAISEKTPVKEGFGVRLWQELFWSCRRVWLGLGAVWAVILLMNVAVAERTVVVARHDGPPATEIMAVMGQRELLRAELGAMARLPVEATPVVPRPRSERRREEMMA